MTETSFIVSQLSNIIWNFNQHGNSMSKESIIEDIKRIVDDYNSRHDKKINY